MNIDQGRIAPSKSERAKLVSGGRLQVPARMRKALGLEDGDQVTMEVKDGILIVRPFHEVLKEVRASFRPKQPPLRGSYTDDFLAERRAEAERE